MINKFGATVILVALAGCSSKEPEQGNKQSSASAATIEASSASSSEVSEAGPVMFGEYRPTFSYRVISNKTVEQDDGRTGRVVFAEFSGVLPADVASEIKSYFLAQGFREGGQSEDKGILMKDYFSAENVRHKVSLLSAGGEPRMSAQAAGGVVVSWSEGGSTVARQ